MKVFGWKNMFFSFSKQNHAESSRNFVKSPILNPKHAKFDEKSWFGHVRTCKSRDVVMSGPPKTCPGGQVLTANQRKYFYFVRNYTLPFFINNYDFLQNHMGRRPTLPVGPRYHTVDDTIVARDITSTFFVHNFHKLDFLGNGLRHPSLRHPLFLFSICQ